jgi:hypothetical protein
MSSDSYLPISYLCFHKQHLYHTFLLELTQFCHSTLEFFLKEKLDE